MNLAGRLILVIDDDLGVLENLVFGLRLQGFRVLSAVDGELGLEVALQSRPDCIVLDVKMRYVSGHHVARLLRGDQATQDIPIVMLSALKQDFELAAGEASGADFYLVKPVALSVLASTIHQAIGRSQTERDQLIAELAKKRLDGFRHQGGDTWHPGGQRYQDERDWPPRHELPRPPWG